MNHSGMLTFRSSVATNHSLEEYYEFFICFILHSKFTSYFSQKLNMIYSQHKCQALHYEKSMQFTSLHKFILVSREYFHVSGKC